MKRNENYIMQQIAGKYVIVPVGKEASDFHGMLSVNATGAYLWELLAQEQTLESLTQALTERYDVTSEQARTDVEEFIKTIKQCNAVTE